MDDTYSIQQSKQELLQQLQDLFSHSPAVDMDEQSLIELIDEERKAVNVNSTSSPFN